MTAEIAILNRQAIALAADSAVTIGRERVWKHTNKLFSLGPCNDIAIMIYGGGEFAGFPWDTIIKTFRSEVGAKCFETEDCGEAFSAFLRDTRFAPDRMNRAMNYAIIVDEMEKIKSEIDSEGYKTKAEFKTLLAGWCDEFKDNYEQQPEITPELTYTDFCASHDRGLMRGLVRDIFGENISLTLAEKVTRTFYEFARRQIESSYSTGVVVAGYGRQEFFPCVLEYKVDGRDGDFVRSWLKKTSDMNDDASSKTVVIPFAQTDIFHLFMEGISPEYIGFINAALGAILDAKSDSIIGSYVADADERTVETARQRRLNRQIVERFAREFGKFRRDQIVQPIVGVVRALPKEEMAEMASALVELTSLRRKVDSSLESVGGPVDVAVISKGDGLIWIKRKHYFDIDKNQEFLYRKTAGRSGDNG